MIRSRLPLFAAAAALSLAPFAVAAQGGPDTLLGIHFYESDLTDDGPTDVEDMSDGLGIWLTEVTLVDPAIANFWEGAPFKLNFLNNAIGAKGHAPILRIQPGWACNVPHPDDPFTVTDYANAAAAAADTLKSRVWVWQVGNEVNIREENQRWNSSDNVYNGAIWEPTPAEYADTYIAVRDAIHTVTPEVGPGEQIVLMQAVSPGPADAFRYYDGYEFLYRQIAAVSDKSKIDGFGLHAYAQPGGSNFGADSFMADIREQLMIIESFGLGDRPVFITEFNKHMPNATEAAIGAQFLTTAYQALADWNEGVGGGTFAEHAIPNPNVVSATWFVYNTTGPGDVWNDYSLEHWKTAAPGTSITQNPWYAFQHAAANMTLPAGIPQPAQASPPMAQRWWHDDFAGTSLNTTHPLPRWTWAPVVGGSTLAVSDGQAIIRGNGNNFGGGSIDTRGYSFSDFTATVEVEVSDATRSGSAGEANFEVRFRERELGYSLTFFTADSQQNPNQVVLRRVNNWGENIQSLNTTVPGGINSGDRFRIEIVADDDEIDIVVFKNLESPARRDAATPVVNWSFSEAGGQRTGRLRVGSYNLSELRVDRVAMGGVAWEDLVPTSAASTWTLY